MIDENCLFCKIISGQIPSAVVFENEKVFAFKDINPQAPVHIVIVPKNHISCADEINSDNSSDVAACFEALPVIAKELGLVNGYRVINNCREDGGQSVMHLHFHLIGGKKLSERIV